MQQPSDVSRDPYLGSRIGDATVVRALRRGPMAWVYQGARDDGEAVAIKIYRRVVQRPHDAQRVLREREAQHRIAHACVAALHGAVELPDGALALVSEWVDGEPLEARLDGRPLPWPVVQPWILDVTRGLHAIHEARVLHRDIKPSNLMLPRHGPPSAKIIDFGHALVLDDERLTDEGQTLGTAQYMPPEQAAGETLDGRADLYALGVVAYRCLTGRLPFDDPSPAVVMERHRSEPVEPPRTLVPEVPPAAEDLVLWLLTKDPAHRVPNAWVLLHTLRAMGS